MSDEHEAIEELLAGHALDGLTGEDAARAEALLADHVPGCGRCRDTVAAFHALRGELALAADPLPAPDTMLPRLHRELGAPSRRRNPARIAAIAASFLIVVAVGGVVATQLDTDGATLTQLSSQDLGQALALAERDDATRSDLGPATEVSAPGMDHFYVYGEAVPAPPAGRVYRLWLVRDDEVRHAGDFVPAPDGTVVLRVDAEPSAWDRLLVTTEPAGSTPSAPGAPVWESAG